MSEARRRIKLRDQFAIWLGWQPRPLEHVEALYAEHHVHAPVDDAAHAAMLRRITLQSDEVER